MGSNPIRAVNGQRKVRGFGQRKVRTYGQRKSHPDVEIDPLRGPGAECPDTRQLDRGRERAAQRVGFACVDPNRVSAAFARGATRERASRIRKLSPEVTTTVA
jgi:hypothetical protein